MTQQVAEEIAEDIKRIYSWTQEDLETFARHVLSRAECERLFDVLRRTED